ncbi:hypothetical protein YC2023_058533 [Brassica napus]
MSFAYESNGRKYIQNDILLAQLETPSSQRVEVPSSSLCSCEEGIKQPALVPGPRRLWA